MSEVAAESTRADIVVTATRSDREWSEWITDVLVRGGFRAVSDDFGFDPQSDFIDALGRWHDVADVVVLVVSEDHPEFFQYGWDEKGPLLVALVEPVELKDPPYNMVELHGLPESQAEDHVLEAARTVANPNSELVGQWPVRPFPGDPSPVRDGEPLAERPSPGFLLVESLGSQMFASGALLEGGLVLTSASAFSPPRDDESESAAGREMVPIVGVSVPGAADLGPHAELVERATSSPDSEIAVYRALEDVPGVVPFRGSITPYHGANVRVLAVADGRLTVRRGALVATDGGGFEVSGVDAQTIDLGSPVVDGPALVGLIVSVNTSGRPVVEPIPDGLIADGVSVSDGPIEGLIGELTELREDGTSGETDDGSVEMDAAETGRTRLVHDQPAIVDRLGRKMLADEVAALVTELAEEQRDRTDAFAMHLDAPWGSGKSTLVGFIGDNLRAAKPPWLVVTVDAWRSSQLSPAWWALLSHVREGVRGSKTGPARAWFDVQRFLDEAMRLWRYWLLPVLMVAAIVVIDVATPDRDIIAAAPAVSAAIALVASLAAIGGRFLSLGTLQGARLHERMNDNPMRDVADRLRWLRVKAERPMLLVLDDIDRCREDFAVELLDAVQTLMRNPTARGKPGTTPPTLVILAVGDHRWLQAAYDHGYHVFADRVGEPGRPLGRLFLDKLFQLHLNLPKLNDAQMRRYLASLLPGSDESGVEKSTVSTDVRAEELRRQVDDVFRSPEAGYTSVDGTLADVATRAVEELDSAEAEAVIGYALAERRRDPRRTERQRHMLYDYAELLDPNPRAAKRFVMAYNINYAARFAEGTDVDIHDLALWTLLSTRWPALADWIRGQLPDGPLEPTGDSNHPSQLLRDPEVNRVIESARGAPLDRQRLLACCGYPRSPTSE